MFWKTFISKIFRELFQNILKIFLSCNSSVYFENIVVCILNRNVWSRYIKLTADTFSTHFCLDKCYWGTIKSLEIKIALFCELFQKRFYFKDVRRKFSIWSVRKFWNFWFHSIINIKNNYYQTFVVVRLMTYIHVKLTLFIFYLFRLYKTHVKKE